MRFKQYEQPAPAEQEENIFVGNLTVDEAFTLIEALHLFNKPGLERFHRNLVNGLATQYNLLKYSSDAKDKRIAAYIEQNGADEMKSEALLDKAMSDHE